MSFLPSILMKEVSPNPEDSCSDTYAFREHVIPEKSKPFWYKSFNTANWITY